ncbi:energy-coupling factor transporter transmembrane component T family protein [Methanohalophilus halophilus]|uniref:Energy-coupling factor transporter transmembrane protein EcfT n=2 Tax=Methanohalophilus halophilus TaxID=2177 RepID=A0A3M9LDW9_9EURY|nr:energy-coupling factor transporter transmembrane component T [Methanohalophilus halophilus]RNI10658.1 energy-coupling factor transporter transmembrane protein EcfT [Methanohalophilus halophilus]
MWMMPDYFLGFVPGDSFLHKLDPRTKLIATMLISILIFRLHVTGLVLIFALFIVLYYLSSVRIAMLRNLRPIAPFLILIFIFQLFLIPGNSFMDLYGFSATSEGFYEGLRIVGRFILLIQFASLLAATTSPAHMTAGVERLLRPLPGKILGVSSFEIATMMSLSIHLVPVLNRFLKEVYQAQLCRGLGRQKRISGLVSLAVPLLRGAFRMMDDISLGMESRCYQGNYRTSLFELKMEKYDWVVLMLVFILLLAFWNLSITLLPSYQI